MRKIIIRDDFIDLSEFEEIKEIKKLTFAILSNGITIKEGNDNKENHFCVENQNGIIKNNLLVDAINANNFPQEITFVKIENKYLSEI